MAKNDNIKDFCTDIADAIRAKKGTSDLINPQDFATEIEGITSGSGGGELEGDYLYFSFNWGEQTSNIVTFFSSVVRISQYSIWLPIAAITNPQTISLIDGCAINLSMKIQNSEMGITSLVTIEDALISMAGENYMESLKQMGFAPITKEQFYDLNA